MQWLEILFLRGQHGGGYVGPDISIHVLVDLCLDSQDRINLEGFLPHYATTEYLHIAH